MKPTELFHLSFIDKLHSTTMYPRVPNSAVNGYEDCITDRICFSNSIDNALAALQGCAGRYYVYIPKNMELMNLYHPSVDEVFDAHITKEVWCLNPVEVVCIGSIINNGVIEMIKHEIDREPFIFHYRICDWKWEDKYTI